MRIGLRNIALFLILLFTLNAKSQIVDTVCASYPFGNYTAHGSANSVFFWNIEGGTLIQSNGADSIKVQWDFSQPDFKLSVVEMNISNCYGDTVKAEVFKGQDPMVYIVGNDSICIGNPADLTATGAPNFLWSDGSTSPDFHPIILGDTSFVLIATNGCGFDTIDVNLTGLENPIASFTYAPSSLVEDEEVIFSYDGFGATKFQWILDDASTLGTAQELRHKFNSAGDFYMTLYVENQYLCYDTASKMLVVHKSVTNCITPDNDGINDKWIIDELNNYPNCEVWIFDRSGAQVFYSEGYSQPWDGKFDGQDLPTGSYYYIIDYGDGSEFRKGTITLLK